MPPSRLKTSLLLYRNALIFLLFLSPIFTFAVPLFTGAREGDIALDSSSNLTNQLVIIFVLFNSIVVAMFFKVRLSHIFFTLLPALPMLSWILFSVAWSNYPDLSLRRGAHEAIDVISLTVLALSFQEDKSIIRVLYWCFLIIVVCDAASLAVPSASFESGTFAGIHESKNEIGAFLFYALPIFAIGAIDDKISIARVIALFAFMIGIAMLILSLSKSAIGVFFIASFLLILTRLLVLRGVHSRIVFPIMVLLFLFLFALFLFEMSVAEVLKGVFGDATLTGRDQLWRYALSKYDDHPLHGIGYGSLWQIGPQFEILMRQAHVRWLANQAHDGYIDILAQLGIVGIAFLILYLGFTLLRILQYLANQDRKHLTLAAYGTYLFWGLLLFNITESSYFRIGHPVWLVFVFVTASVTGLIMRKRSSLGNSIAL